MENTPSALTRVLPSPVSELDGQPTIGSLRADLGGELEDGRSVLLELQINRSDAVHLGQVVAYTSVAQPDVMVWVAESWRPEDVEAVRTLNDHPDFHLMAVTITMVRIDSSPPAPMFQVVAGAHEPLQRESRARTQRQDAYESFWNRVSQHAQSNPATTGFEAPRSCRQKWSAVSAKRGSGVVYRLQVAADRCMVLVYIDAGPESAPYNSAVLDALAQHRDSLASSVSHELQWTQDDGRRCMVGVTLTGGYTLNPGDTARRAVECLVEIQNAFGTVLPKLPWTQLQKLAP